MEKEDKELLIKDLCGRFPYNVMCKISDGKTTITEVLKIGGLREILNGTLNVKPYLRPMVNMTDEERETFNYLCESRYIYSSNISGRNYDYYDWLNSHHFDYRDLIEKGLALEAPETMYAHFGDMKTDIKVTKK